MEIRLGSTIQYLATVQEWWSDKIGGIVRFCRQDSGRFSIHSVEAKPFSVVLIDSMLPKNTANMIQRVKELREQFPRAVECLFDCIDELVKTATGDDVLEVDKLVCATRVNQNVLRALGVSCEAIDRIVEVAEQHGFVAKLTGGGGGGCVVAIRQSANDSDESRFIDCLDGLGFLTQQIQLGGEGVKVDFIHSIV